MVNRMVNPNNPRRTAENSTYAKQAENTAVVRVCNLILVNALLCVNPATTAYIAINVATVVVKVYKLGRLSLSNVIFII